MSEQSMPWDAEEENGVYDRVFYSEDFAAMFAAFWGNGVFDNPTDALQVVSKGNGMEVSVLKGRGHINGRFYVNTADKDFAVPEANSSNARIDSIVLRMEAAKKTITLQYVAGVPAAKPVAADLVRTETIYDLRIAEITVNTNATGIAQSNIADKRYDDSVCGRVSVIAAKQFLAHFSDFKNPHKTSLGQILGTDDAGGVVPIANGGTGAKDAETARKNLGAQPAGNYQPAGDYAASDHDHNYAGANTPGGAANSAVKLQTKRGIRVGNQTNIFDGSGDITFTLSKMGAAAASHEHSFLSDPKYINAVYGDKGRTILITDNFLFDYNNDNPYIGMNTVRTMTFLGCGITGDSFAFAGDVRIEGDIYGSPAIKSSDVREKHDILDINKRYEAMFQALRPVTFVYNEGNSGRSHIGFISQEVEKALLDAGLTTEEFAGFVKMPVFGTKEIHGIEIQLDANGKEIEVPTTRTEVDTNIILDYRYKLRYDEFTALNTHMIQRLMQRVEALEAKVAEMEGNMNGN